MYFYFVIKYLVLRITLINLDRLSRSHWGADTCWVSGYVIVHMAQIRVRVIGFNYQDHAMW
jgi:hypothetical protein